MNYAPLWSKKDEQTGIEVHVVAFTRHEQPLHGRPLLTVQCRYPRMIHAELMTHRVFSRNARSSRAVPTEVLLKEEPYLPIFGQNQKGMQPGTELSPEDAEQALYTWKEGALYCQKMAEALHGSNVHKQWANRPLEWFGYIDVVITSTEWDNFFGLRCSEYAQYEIRVLAELIREGYSAASMISADDLRPLDFPWWHLPYVTQNERQTYDLHDCLAMSVARCARVSYKPFDGNGSVEKDKALVERLQKADPMHASPFEHQAEHDWLNRHDIGKGQTLEAWGRGMHRNFVGWSQYRALMEEDYFKVPF